MIKTIYKKVRIEHFNIFAVSGVAVLVFSYLLIINSVAMANYQKTALQKDIDGLKTAIKNLNLELADKRSIGFLKKSADKLNLVTSEDIQYVKIVGPVAKNP